MAGRPNKVGLDYFELDCLLDDNVKLIQAEFGLKGFAVVVKLYQKIYGSNGYYCEWNEDVLFLFLVENGLSGDSKNLINEIVMACIRRGIFSEKLFNKFGILTSSGVQKRYLNATSKRENVELKKEYLLISVGKNRNNVVINSINDSRNSINDIKNEQSKVEKSRVENNTVSKDTVRQTDVRHVMDAWNSLVDCGIKPIQKISSSSKRYSSLMARIREYGIDEVINAIEKIRHSKFLQGKSGGRRQWIITFDWFVLPSNFPKVLEGNYDDEVQDTDYNTSFENDNGIWGGVRQ